MSHAWWSLLHVLGVDDTTGYWYGFWSGFGSDLGEVAIVGGLVSIYRRHTCHVRLDGLPPPPPRRRAQPRRGAGAAPRQRP